MRSRMSGGVGGAAGAILPPRPDLGFPTESLPMHEKLWQEAGKEGFGFRRLYDVRTALGLLSQGVTEFATANTKDFTGLGFRRVWNPLAS